MFKAYRINHTLGNGMRPDGKLHAPHEFKGCDLRWLLETKAITGVGKEVPGAVLVPDEMTTAEQYMEEIQRLQEQLIRAKSGESEDAEDDRPGGVLPPPSLARGDTFVKSSRVVHDDGNDAFPPINPTPKLGKILSAEVGQTADIRELLADMADEIVSRVTENLSGFKTAPADGIPSLNNMATAGDRSEVEQLRSDLHAAQSVAADAQNRAKELETECQSLRAKLADTANLPDPTEPPKGKGKK